MKLLFFLCMVFQTCGQLIDLQDLSSDFILETKRIQLVDYPYAFNPSIIRWKDYILMSFRVIFNPKTPYVSWMGVILLDKNFNPISEPQFLNVRSEETTVPSRAEDGRLFSIEDKLFIIYSDNLNPISSKGGFRMTIGELVYDRGLFDLQNINPLTEYEGENDTLREKNWVPFNYKGSLFLAYSINPHFILHPLPGTRICETIAKTEVPFSWDWGVLRGGTQAFLIESGKYLSFFHSVKEMSTIQTKGETMAHYFIGGYLFESEPPFRITHCSQRPIVGTEFYSGKQYKPYWGIPTQCVFPAGLMIEEDAIWLSFGRQDHEIWIAKLDKKKFLESLIEK